MPSAGSPTSTWPWAGSRKDSTGCSGWSGRTSGEERNRARVHLVSLFDVFPPREPRVARARAKLSSLLF